MRVIKAINLAFSTFTRIPMPQIKYSKEDIDLSLAFWPLTGCVIGYALWYWAAFCDIFYLSGILFAAVATVLPLIITGGIHMDGYCDTVDALSANREQKRAALDVLDDPHIGAFALIRCVVYLFLYFALTHELYYSESTSVLGLYFVFPLSRCFAALTAVSFPKAKETGMLASFTGSTSRAVIYIILLIFTVLFSAGYILNPKRIVEGTFPPAIAALIICAAYTLKYKRMTQRHFGGITGDTTGYYLQMTEIILLAGVLMQVLY